MRNFIDEILEEAEAKEEQLLLSYADLILKEIGELQSQIELNFTTADEEKKIIDDWALTKNSRLQDRITWLETKLEAFMNEQGQEIKTIDLAYGKLTRRKQQPKVEIVDLELFMQNENLYQLGTTSPESIKPNLNMIKAFIKMTTKIPKGVKYTEQKEEKFTIKIKQHGGSDERKKEIGTRAEQADKLKAVI